MIEKIIEGVWRIQGQDDFLPDSHVYLIGLPGSGDFTLVDCGLMGMGSYKLDAVEQAGISLKQVKRIVLTHTHLDHVGCLPEFREAMPDAEIWAHKAEADYLERGDLRIVFGNSMFESMLRSQYDMPKDFLRTPVQRKLEGGETVSLGGMEFTVEYVPGHSIGSIGLFNKDNRLFLSGDTIYADWAIGRWDLLTGDAAQLKRSLESIAELGIDILLPCHNRIIRSGAEPMVKETLSQWGPMLDRG
ncbi:MAG: MBL fold metallo-hydrolase [Pseudomonadota bacterium]